MCCNSIALWLANLRFGIRKAKKLGGSADEDALISMVPKTIKIKGKEIFTCMMTLESTDASKIKYYNEKEIKMRPAAGVNFGKKDDTSAPLSERSKTSRPSLNPVLKDQTPAQTAATANNASSTAQEA